MSNVTANATSISNTHAITNPVLDNKGVTPPVIKPTEPATNLDSKNIQKNDTMSWTQVSLRGLYGAAACGIYVSGHRAIFQKPLLPKDLAIVAATCGAKAMVMSTAIKAIRKGYRELIPGNKHQLTKDIAEATMIDAIETGVSFFQDKATAKNVDALKMLGLSAAKSYPNNFMDTPSYSKFVDWYAGKNKLSENPSEDEQKEFKQRKESFGNYVITPLAALVTAIPATYLNNEPFTPTNFAKTIALRIASVKLWRKAMNLAKAHSGDAEAEKPVALPETIKPTEVTPAILPARAENKPNPQTTVDVPEAPAFPFKSKPAEA